MQVYDAYPARAVGGSCFITKDYDVSDGKRVLSLDIDLSTMPMSGLLCVSEEGVRQMNVALGWVADEDGARVLAEARAEVEALRAKVAEQGDALSAIANAYASTGNTFGPDVEVTVTEPVVIVHPDPEPPAAPAKNAAPRKPAARKPK